MLVLLVILLGLCSGLSKSFPTTTEMDLRKEPLFERGLSSDSVNEEYDSYYSISKNKEDDQELNVVSRVQRVDLNKIKYSHIYDINGETYVVVKSSRHRNKRYTSYLTLCPFKICSMGRKRRYIKAIRGAGDNEGT